MFKNTSIMFSLHLGILFAFSTVLAEVPQKPKSYITAPSLIMKSSFPARPHKKKAVLITCERTITVCIRNSMYIVNCEESHNRNYSYSHKSNSFICFPGVPCSIIDLLDPLEPTIFVADSTITATLTVDSHIVQTNGELRCGYPYSTFLDLIHYNSSRSWEYRYIPIPKDTTCTAIDDFKFLCKYRR